MAKQLLLFFFFVSCICHQAFAADEERSIVISGTNLASLFPDSAHTQPQKMKIRDVDLINITTAIFSRLKIIHDTPDGDKLVTLYREIVKAFPDNRAVVASLNHFAHETHVTIFPAIAQAAIEDALEANISGPNLTQTLVRMIRYGHSQEQHTVVSAIRFAVEHNSKVHLQELSPDIIEALPDVVRFDRKDDGHLAADEALSLIKLGLERNPRDPHFSRAFAGILQKNVGEETADIACGIAADLFAQHPEIYSANPELVAALEAHEKFDIEKVAVQTDVPQPNQASFRNSLIRARERATAALNKVPNRKQGKSGGPTCSEALESSAF